MKNKRLYRVIQLHPLPKRELRRTYRLTCADHEIFACQWEWLAYLVCFCCGGSVEYSQTFRGNVEMGSELADEFCKVYGVKDTRDAFKLN